MHKYQYFEKTAMYWIVWDVHSVMITFSLYTDICNIIMYNIYIYIYIYVYTQVIARKVTYFPHINGPPVQGEARLVKQQGEE